MIKKLGKDMKQYLALKASAGSGKTFALTIRYISLLLLGANPKEILTLTFTNKASAEMSSRIFQTLSDLGDDENIINELIKQTNLTQKEILEKKPILTHNYLSSQINILTLDKFFNQVLKEFSSYLGLDSDFVIQNDDKEYLEYLYLKSLNQDELQNLIFFNSFEAKKLTTIFNNFRILLDKNDEIAQIRFQEEIILDSSEILNQANIIKKAINSHKDSSSKAHSAVDFNDIDGLLDKGKTWLTKERLEEFSFFKKPLKTCPNIEELNNHFTTLKDLLISYLKDKSNFLVQNYLTLYEHFFQERLKYKLQNNSLEFIDISNMLLKLFEIIDQEFVYFRLDSRYSHILIDEFQDTSTLQYRILEPLIEELIAGKSSDSIETFFYVGDTKQSIYRFRGGQKELFDYLLEMFPQIEVEELDTNYRSKKEIIEFVNHTFVDISDFDYTAQKYIQDGGYVEVLEDEYDSDEPYLVVKNQIIKLLSHGVASNNITILTHTNEDISNIYEYLKEFLSEKNIEIATELSSKLINQNNINAIINLIKYLFFAQDIYLANFNNFIDRDLSSKDDLDSLDTKENLATLIYEIASVFNLIDENLMLFVQEIKQYKDIVDFVYEIDKNESVVSSKLNDGIKIMTIFKSKGLEFDSVILLDRLKNSPANRDSFVFEYDNLRLRNVHYKLKMRDKLDESYQNIIDEEKSKQTHDEYNKLYVALTRAKSNMIICKKVEKSIFDSINLLPSTIGTITKSDTIIEISTPQTIGYEPLKLGLQETKLKNIEEESEENIYARYYGIATHYCLEMMNKFDEASLQIALSQTKSRYNIYLKEYEFDKIYQSLSTLIKDKFFISLTDGAKISKEVPLLYNSELKQIDLLIQKDDIYTIIDYKTTSQMSDEHINQVQNYMKAVSNITKCEVNGYVCYISTNIVFKKI